LNKRRREEEHETRKRDLEQKLGNEKTRLTRWNDPTPFNNSNTKNIMTMTRTKVRYRSPQDPPKFPFRQADSPARNLQDKFDPFNLYKLHRDAGLAVENDVNVEDFAISKGRLGLRREQAR
jgi:hypothetical protein